MLIFLALWGPSLPVKQCIQTQKECVHMTSRQPCWRSKQRNGGHLGWVKYSFGDWTLFLCKSQTLTLTALPPALFLVCLGSCVPLEIYCRHQWLLQAFLACCRHCQFCYRPCKQPELKQLAPRKGIVGLKFDAITIIIIIMITIIIVIITCVLQVD